MKILITLCLMLLSSANAFAICEVYTKHGQDEKICFVKEFKAYVNKPCFNLKCDGLTFLAANHPKPATVDRSMGRRPSTQYCKHYSLGVYILQDGRGNQQSFCSFADGSLIDAGAIARSLK